MIGRPQAVNFEDAGGEGGADAPGVAEITPSAQLDHVSYAREVRALKNRILTDFVRCLFD